MPRRRPAPDETDLEEDSDDEFLGGADSDADDSGSDSEGTDDEEDSDDSDGSEDSEDPDELPVPARRGRATRAVQYVTDPAQRRTHHVLTESLLACVVAERCAILAKDDSHYLPPEMADQIPVDNKRCLTIALAEIAIGKCPLEILVPAGPNVFEVFKVNELARV